MYKIEAEFGELQENKILTVKRLGKQKNKNNPKHHAR